VNCFTLLEVKPEMLCQGHHRRATVLKSQVATEVTLTIMRTFTKIREFALNYKDIANRIEAIEKTIKTDQQHQN
jgi:succinate dehydrogenase/fumarate reductase-like Fe-S protein